MELASAEKTMAPDPNHLYIRAIGMRSRYAHPRRHHGLFILTVEFVTMTVSFADLGLTVDSVRKRSRFDFARPRAQPHGATKLFHSTQLAEFINHPVRSRRIELTRVGIRQSANV